MGPKTKLKKPNKQESDQSDNSDSSIESDDEYSGNEVNILIITINIHIYGNVTVLVFPMHN